MFCVFFFNKKKKLVNRPSPASSWQSTAHPAQTCKMRHSRKKKYLELGASIKRGCFCPVQPNKSQRKQGKSRPAKQQWPVATKFGAPHTQWHRSCRKAQAKHTLMPAWGFKPGHHAGHRGMASAKEYLLITYRLPEKLGLWFFFVCVCLRPHTHCVCKSVLEFYDAFQVVMTCWRRLAASLSLEPACWPILGVLTPPSLAWSCCFLVLAFWP